MPAASPVAVVAAPDHRRGSILIVVLMLVGLLAALAAAAGEMQRASYAAGLAHADTLRAEQAMRSAIERTVAHGGQRTAQLRGGIVRLEQATVTLDITDEASRLDLNLAPPVLLAGLLRAVGIPATEAEEHAKQISDWRLRAGRDSPEPGPERIAFDGEFFPTNPFLHPAQLVDVPGLGRQTAVAILRYVTVSSSRPTINAMLAELPVLMAVPGLTSDRARAFLAERQEGPQALERLSREVRGVNRYLAASSGGAARFRGRVRIGERTERVYEVVVSVVAGDDVPYRILSWEAVASPAAAP